MLVVVVVVGPARLPAVFPLEPERRETLLCIFHCVSLCAFFFRLTSDSRRAKVADVLKHAGKRSPALGYRSEP